MNQACSPQQIESAADISFPTITVNDTVISAETIADEMQYHPADAAESALLESVRALIIKQLLEDEIDKLQLNTDDSKSSEQTVSLLLERQTSPSKATEAECHQYYQMNEARFSSEPLIAARHILLAASPEDVAERQKVAQQANTLLTQLQSNIDNFPSFAKEYSSCPSKDTGGELGQLSKGQTTPEFERQVFTLPEGLAKKPIESRYGFHVVDIEKRVDGEQLPFKAVAPKISQYLNEQAQRKSISGYIRSLIDQADIDGIDKEVLSPGFDNG